MNIQLELCSFAQLGIATNLSVILFILTRDLISRLKALYSADGLKDILNVPPCPEKPSETFQERRIGCPLGWSEQPAKLRGPHYIEVTRLEGK
jgi:hypothetical protein